MFAERMSRISESGTVRISNIVGKLRSEGKDIVSFALGEPDFPTPRHIVEAASRALNEGFTHYTPSNGIPELREAIAEKMQKENCVNCAPANVMVTPAKQAIFMTIMALVDEGDEVIIPDPAWVSYVPIVNFAGGKPVFVQTSGDDFSLKAEDVADRVTERTKMIIVNSPSNPTGGLMDRNGLELLADLATDRKLIVLSDEIYEKIIYEGTHHSIASFDGMFERTVTINGFSKAYAMTGWRLGYMVADKPVLDQVGKLQQQSITCAASFAQKAGVAALKGGDDCVRKMVDEFRARRDLLVKRLNSIKGFRCGTPKGAFYTFPSFDFKMSSSEFTEHLLKEAQVSVTPGIEFGPSGEGHVRFSYAASRENIEKGMDRIARAVETLR